MNKKIMFSLIILMLNIGVVTADEMYYGTWMGAGTNWDEPDNWQSPDTNPPWVTGIKVPEPGDLAIIREDHVDITTDANSVQVVYMGEYSDQWNLDGTASMTIDGGQLRVEMIDPALQWDTGCFHLGQADSNQLPVGEVSGTLTMNSGRLDVDHYLALGTASGAEGLINMNGGELYVGFNPQPDPSYPALYVGSAGYGHIEMAGGTIHCNWLELDGWDGVPGSAGTSGGTIHFAGSGGKIIIYDDTVLGKIQDYITNGDITHAAAEVVGNTVEITDLCIIPAADLNDDCVVDLLDFTILAGEWLEDGS